MKPLYVLCTFLFLSMQLTLAQTYTLNWGSSFSGTWNTGATSGTATNIENSLVNAAVALTNTQGNSYGNFAGFTSPRASSAGNPFTTQLNSNVSNLAIGVDWDNDNSYVDIVITFNTAVRNVTFNVADIDKAAGNSNTYIDEIRVTGTNSGTAVTNPTLSKVVTSSNFITISGNVATANTSNGQGGNSASSTTDQRATVNVNFGSTILTSVTIRYRNNAASQNDPDDQAIGIGNISFERAVALPLTLNSFNGAVINNSVQLNWSSGREENLAAYIVEKSTDGVKWQTLSTVPAVGNSNSTEEYNTIDLNVAVVNYYRLKQVDIDGDYTYSQIIRIRSNTKEKAGIRLYPNPVINEATVTINSETKLAAHIKVYNQSGIKLNHLQRQLIAGSNNIPIAGINRLPAGSYFIIVEDEQFNTIGTTQFIKQ
jgi:hypothetical protein